jgi:hypothetical protein
VRLKVIIEVLVVAVTLEQDKILKVTFHLLVMVMIKGTWQGGQLFDFLYKSIRQRLLTKV